MSDLISRQAEQQGRVFKEIVVEYSSYNTYPERKWIPYFSIKYTENGQEFIGYGTYKPEVLSQYLKEYFMPSAQPEIIRCKDCKHWRQQTNYQGAPLSFGFCESDDMWRSLYGETYEVSHIDTDDDFYCGYAERRTDGGLNQQTGGDNPIVPQQKW